MILITAEKIHDGNGWMPIGTTLEIEDDGAIARVHPTPVGNTIFYDGILAPGFVNAHCHTELSHIKGAIPEHTGLIPFIESVIAERDKYTDEEKRDARFAAYIQMLDNGIVAVGDIANTTDSMDIRAMGKLHFHTFIEALGFAEVSAARSFGYALQNYHVFEAQNAGDTLLRQSIVPHAPYSVSEALFRLIDEYDPISVLSIHNQESAEEDSYYKDKRGGIKELLAKMNVNDAHFTPTGISSIQSYLKWLSDSHPFIFVHNTCTTKEDLLYVLTHVRDPYWCLCPRANLYIEDRLPDVNMFIEENAQVCIGTDSLSSNKELSILSELLTIKQHYPDITWEVLLRWGTRNGAYAMRLQDNIGSIAVGKKPGIIQVKGIFSNEGTPEVIRII